MSSSSLYLGIDSSTQGIKASIISSESLGQIIHHRTINYDRDLPHYHTTQGMYKTDQGNVHSPVLMWLEALDLLLSQIVLDSNQGTSTSGQSFRLSDVVALSGSGQQHGSVYWSINASKNLSNLDPNISLANQLGYSFAKLNSPIWADSSTSEQCVALESNFGGPEKLAFATGSRAYERFTGNQIAKIYTQEKEIYNNCEHISLVSSFMCSLFIGKYAPIDTSDGSGTNLNDLLSNQGTIWCEEALEVCGGTTLKSKLGDHMVPAHTYVGNICNYFVYKYGFSKSCEIIAWSGDNPCSLAGLGLQQVGDIAVSLGTSDTMFTMMHQATPGKDGHVSTKCERERCIAYMESTVIENVFCLSRISFILKQTQTSFFLT